MGLDDKQIESIIEAHADTVTGLKDEIDTYKAKASRVPELEARIKELEGDTSSKELQERLKEAQSKLEESEKAHKQEVANLKQEATNAQNKVAEVEKERDSLNEQLETKETEHAAQLEAKQTEFNEQLAAKQTEFDGLQTQFDEYKADVEAKEGMRAKAQAYRTQVLGAAGVAPTYLDDVMAVTKLDGIELDEDGNISGADELVEKAKQKWGSFVVRERIDPAEVETPPAPPKGKGNEIDGAHERAMKIARERHERMYGKAQS